MRDYFDSVEQLTKTLVEIPSVNSAPGEESTIAQFIHDYYADLDYFQSHPHHLSMPQTRGDFVERHNVLSLVRGSKAGGSNRTVILLSHIDTVGIDDYGEYKAYATQPDQLPTILKEHFALSDEVLADLETDRYMFGRGALDMKSGVAVHMQLMKYFSEHPETLSGNLIALHECDEEGNSFGMLSAIEDLVELKQTESLEYIAAINSDYSTALSPTDDSVYIYHGSIGKHLPMVSVFGKEAHVGQSFAAFDPNLLTAMITKNVSLNPILSDKAQGEVTLPPISLKQSDEKIEYTVQTALNSYAYYNVFTHGKNPAQIIASFRRLVEQAYTETIELLQAHYDEYCRIADIDTSRLPWKERVYTWDELLDYLENTRPGFTEELEQFKHELHRQDPCMDMRQFSHEVVKFAWKRLPDPSPGVVIHLAGVYYARVETRPESKLDKALLESVDAAIHKVLPDAKRSIKTRRFYPYISDSSFLAVSDDPKSLQYMQANMPAYGAKYVHPLEQILAINVPVVNIGSFGKDGHMITERVDRWHSFQNVPRITWEVLQQLLD